MENQAILLKEAILSNLSSAKELDAVLVKTEQLRKELAGMKKANPELSVKDIDTEITEFFEMNQRASLIVKDIDSLSNRIVGLKMAADLLNLDLELNEEDTRVVDTIRAGSEIFFFVDGGKLIATDEELINKFMEQTKEKYFTDEVKETIFNSL